MKQITNLNYVGTQLYHYCGRHFSILNLFKIILFKFSIACFLFITSSPVLSADFYDAEIIIFSQLKKQADDENLPWLNPHYIDFQLQLNDLINKKRVIELEPATDSKLSEVAKILRDSDNYEILFHGQWSQTSVKRTKAPYVLIDLPRMNQPSMINGVILLFATDLLYLDLLLRYQPKYDNDVNPAILRPYYFINQRRRIKFKEVHFIDHPKFGAIVTVSPVTLDD